MHHLGTLNVCAEYGASSFSRHVILDKCFFIDLMKALNCVIRILRTPHTQYMRQFSWQSMQQLLR